MTEQLKALLDDLGGGRAAAAFAAVGGFVLVAAHGWIDGREAAERALSEAISVLTERVRVLEIKQAGDDVIHETRSAYTAAEGRSLDRRIKRIEDRADQRGAGE